MRSPICWYGQKTTCDAEGLLAANVHFIKCFRLPAWQADALPLDSSFLSSFLRAAKETKLEASSCLMCSG